MLAKASNLGVMFLREFLHVFGVPGPCCRFQPSCSVYMRGAIHEHGVRRGVALGLQRIFRCRPGGAWGADPVPRKHKGDQR